MTSALVDAKGGLLDRAMTAREARFEASLSHNGVA
jgi:hypothetical protein